MKVLVDTSAIIAVIVNESQRKRIIELTQDKELVAPASIPWEIGNAFSAMFKQGRLTLGLAKKALAIFDTIAIRYVETNLFNSIVLSKKHNLYAYDAYILDCAKQYNLSLLTLDQKLLKVAKSIGIRVLEV